MQGDWLTLDEQGDKADNWWMRFHERTLKLKWRKGVKRPDKSNAVDLLSSGLVPKGGIEKESFEKNFEEGQTPAVFSQEEREAWLKKLSEVAVSSDAFVSIRLSKSFALACALIDPKFPFIDNILRASRSGVKYIAAPTGSQNDQPVFDTAEQLGMAFIEQPVSHFLDFEITSASLNLDCPSQIRLFHH